ncbi:MAG TPA: DUF4272 domain-containing protein [Steroidobacteraceae bacterium]
MARAAVVHCLVAPPSETFAIDRYCVVYWKARDAQLHERPMPPGIDIEIVQERHHAINWVTGYDGLPWDEVTTDT